ncbi:MAG: hypothetical protein WDO56_04265 [Gammaproteobacteria bacterium]
MNASLKSVSRSRSGSNQIHGRASAHAVQPDIIAEEGVLEMPGEMQLYHGGKVPGVRIAWRVVGPANAPVVCALGGISANRYVCTTEDLKQSWWGQIAGTGCPLDSDRFRVLSFDYLGGSGDSTGPGRRRRLPERFQLRPGRCAPRAAGSAEHQVPACHRRRLIRRHGGARFR